MDIDRAWDKLHARLVDEQLLDQSTKTVTMPFISKMKWAATIALLCILGGTVGLYVGSKKESVSIVSIHNSDVFNTLVRTLDDGSIVYLASGSALTCPERFAADKRQVSLQGEAMFDVHSDKSCPFLIETESALVEVTGTKFNIKSDGKESFVLSVLHGSVVVTLKADGLPVRVESGETVLLQSGRLYQTELADMHLFARYTQKMQFKDEQLEHIVRVINKISDKPVMFADSDLKNREITITFSNNTAEEMVELLCVSLDLKYTDNGEEMVIDR